MSLKKMMMLIVPAAALLLCSCAKDEGKDTNPISPGNYVPPDPVTFEQAMDTLAPVGNIDSSETWSKTGNVYVFSGLIENDSFTVVASGGFAKLTSTSGEVTLTITALLYAGDGTSFEGSVWKITKVTMSNADTAVSYTIEPDELVLAYPGEDPQKIYRVESNINFDSVMNNLAMQLIYATICCLENMADERVAEMKSDTNYTEVNLLYSSCDSVVINATMEVMGWTNTFTDTYTLVDGDLWYKRESGGQVISNELVLENVCEQTYPPYPPGVETR